MMIGLSKIAVPSASSKQGILPSGFCWRSVSFSSSVSAGTTAMRPARPRISAAMRTLRPKGEVSDVLRMNSAAVGTSPGAAFCCMDGK